MWDVLQSKKGEETDGYTLAFAPLSDYVESTRDKSGIAKVKRFKSDWITEETEKASEGSYRGFYKIVPLADNVCRVTLYRQAAFAMPLMRYEKAVKKSLASVRAMQLKFERKMQVRLCQWRLSPQANFSPAHLPPQVVDTEIRKCFRTPPNVDDMDENQQDFASNCRQLEETSTSQDYVVRRNAGDKANDRTRLRQHSGTVRAALGTTEESPWVQIESQSPHIDSYMRYRTTENGGVVRPIVLVKCESVIGCSPDEALAWYFTFCSKFRTATALQGGDRGECSAQPCATA